LIVDGVTTTNFRSSGLIPLTYNQSQTSGAFDKMTSPSAEWASVLNDMATNQSSGNIAAVKDFLARTSGYFLANVIRNMAADSPNNQVYDKIRNHAEEYKTNGSLWVQATGGWESFKKDENSLEDYADTSYGAMLGYDRFIAKDNKGGDLMWGVYGRFNRDNIKQGESKANGDKSGLGLYGGYLREKWELKAMLHGEYDAVSTQRQDYVGAAAKADINAITVSADIEAALKIWLTENIHLRPYLGAEAANVMYNGFNETGGGMFDLNTRSGNYLRTTGRAGLGADYEKGRWILYGQAEGKYIFDGTKPEVTSQFVNTGIDFNSRGSAEGSLQGGLGAGAEYRISANWKIFANGRYYMAERYENLYGNIGVRYMFGKREKTAKAPEEKKVMDLSKAGELASQANQKADKVQEINKETLSAQTEPAEKIKLYESNIETAKAAISQANESGNLLKEAQGKIDEYGDKVSGRGNVETEIAAIKAKNDETIKKAKAEIAFAQGEIEKAEAAKRAAEEAAITKEISDADLAKQKAEAEARRKRTMLKTYTLTTHFATNSYELNEEDKKQIGAIAEELKGLDYKKIAIEGHTDNTGSKETNKRLSRQRARSVYDEFINAGISSEKMTYQGFADTMPVKSNSTAEGRAANRRTEIFVE
ncbi:MAG: autotransporter domain-containing protein, partial [Endomicrobia bacterium]|nr:autotransporter domain-containing protein [Endomicrobiia bacterium]